MLLQLWLLVVSAWPGTAVAASTSVLDLNGPVVRFEAWPVVRVLLDPSHALGLADVMERRVEFASPDVPRNNFGPRTEAVWFRVPVQTSEATAGRWMVEVDYPPLNRIEAWVVAADRVVEHALMGSDVPTGTRPIRSRSHVFAFDLEPGSVHEIYLRIESASTLAAPIQLHREADFVQYESGRMLLLGLMFGATLLLLASTVFNWISLRDPMFFFYAMLLVGISMFFVSFSGLGHQALWSTQAGRLEKISPIGALIAMSAASLFVISALELRRRNPRLAQYLQAAAACGVVAIVAAAVGLIDYRQTSLAATILGPIQIVLALVESIRQARTGSRMAVYLAVGWGAYAIGSLSLALMLRGLIAVDLLTQNLFQISSLVEMFAWMRVLSIRIEAIRHDAHQAAAENRALHALAHTDALTGLLNRRGLELAIENALASGGSTFAIYLIDLDGFKAVNDRMGHEAGDKVLAHVGRRLRAAMREGDVAARMGGDEFVVLAFGVHAQATALVVGRKMLDQIREPIQVAGQGFANIGATIGFALAPEDGTQAGILLRLADAAMYAGKTAGRQCVQRGHVAGMLADQHALPDRRVAEAR